jgi:hypothetical protein
VSGHELEGCQAKVDQARKHKEALQAEWERFVDEDKPYSSVGEFDAKSGWHTEYLKITKEPPLTLSVIVGDLVHNLRSALDHLVWQFVIANGETPGKWNHFPACTDWNQWVERVVIPAHKGKNHALAGIDPLGEAWALIESMQPYRRPNPQYAPVAVLESLWNVDKHQTLHASYVAMDKADVNLLFRWNPDAREPIEDEFRLHTYDTLEDGAVIARLRFARPGPDDPAVHMQGKLPLFVAFGEDEAAIKDATLAKLGEFVELALKQAEGIIWP